MIVIAGASESEIRSVRSLITPVRVEYHAGRQFFFGTLHGRDVCLVQIGVGRKNASAAARMICAAVQPRLVIIAGAAGALDPELGRGTIVIVDSIVGENPAQEIICPENLSLRAVDILREAGMQAHIGRCCQANSFVHRASDKYELYRRTRARVVDMESAALASELQRAGVPFVNLRVVSDTALHDTVDIATLARLRYRSGLPTAVLWLCRRPRELARAVSLYRGIHTAAARLAVALSIVMEVDDFTCTPLGA